MLTSSVFVGLGTQSICYITPGVRAAGASWMINVGKREGVATMVGCSHVLSVKADRSLCSNTADSHVNVACIEF